MVLKYLKQYVKKYTESSFLSLLYELNDQQTTINNLCSKNHLLYLKSYFSKDGLDVKFILVENDYISKNYLSDYSNYYSLCYSDYKKKCSRVHFFTYKSDDIKLFQHELSKCIEYFSSNKPSNKIEKASGFFEKNYVGFIVINPIPNTFIGYTILKHYNSKRNKANRYFWGTKQYTVHLFGFEIPIRSLAFHEQDSNVGACATIAVWSVFQIASEDYYVNLKSPYEITNDAGITNYNGQRLLPNSGLVPHAICNAITKNKLVTEIRDLSKDSNIIYLKRLIYAYSSIGIPIILCIKVPEQGKCDDGHAVAISGHSLDELTFSNPVFDDKSFFNRADFISQIYFHDDQWGPFVKSTIVQYDADVSHFATHHNQRKYDVIEKVCPVCTKKFKTRSGQSKEKTTCSRSCANVFFKSGQANGNYKGTHYRTICFSLHEHKCAICDEKNIVEVHHFNGNKSDNNPLNLIPLCPTHHQYWHSRFRNLIESKIFKYIDKIKNK